VIRGVCANDRQTDGQSDIRDNPVHNRANQYTICDLMELKEMTVLYNLKVNCNVILLL
jgi:hypothetical protein